MSTPAPTDPRVAALVQRLQQELRKDTQDAVPLPSSSSASSSSSSSPSRTKLAVVQAPGRVNLIGEHIDYSGTYLRMFLCMRDTTPLYLLYPTEGTNSTVLPFLPDLNMMERALRVLLLYPGRHFIALLKAHFRVLQESRHVPYPVSESIKPVASVPLTPLPPPPPYTTNPGFAVLPMALEQQTIMIAIGKHPSLQSGVKVLNLDHNKFPETRLLSVASPTFTSKTETPHDWTRYVECALQGVRRHFSGLIDEKHLNGLVLLVHGTIPPAAGLSSSSALVVAAALAFCWAIGKADLRKNLLAALCVECERLVGTAGGGMDQTVACLAEPGKAVLIEFEPRVRTTAVPLPPGVVVVVADCRVKAEKAVSATTHFNKRVVECQIATWLMAKTTDIPDWVGCETMRQLEMYSDWPLVEFLSDLPPGEVTVKQLQRALCVGDFFPDFPASFSEAAALVVANNKTFNVRDRAVHVVNEAERVRRFAALCHDAQAAVGARAQSLGRLMNRSHDSCSEKYDCSCPELDALVEVCQDAPGCYGARLTGAGWGGMCVALCDEERVEEFMADVKKRFYKKWGIEDGDNEAPHMFVTRPGGGAGVVWEGTWEGTRGGRGVEDGVEKREPNTRRLRARK